MRLTRVLSPLFVLTALTVPATVVHAQRNWHDEQGRSAFRFDFAIPFLKSNGFKFYTGTFVPSMSLQTGDDIRVEADLPFTRADSGSKSTFRLGNAYLGLRIGDDDKPVSGILGVRAPLGKTPNTLIGAQAVAAGIATDYDMLEAYSPNLLTFQGGLEYHRARTDGLMFGARGVLSLQMNTGGNPQADSEILLDYGARFGYQGPRVLATLALTGRYVITAPDNRFQCIPGDGLFDEDCNPKGFEERTHNQLAGVLELRPGRVRPRVTLRVPLDKDLRNVAGAVFGLGLSIAR